MTTKGRLAAEAWGSLLRAHAVLVPLLDKELSETAGISLGSYDVLLELSAAPQHQLRMSDLGNRVVLSRTRVSRIVDDLVDDGLVLRESSAEDGRSSFAVLTPEGLCQFKAAARVYLRLIERHFASQLDEGELTTLVRGLGRITQHTDGSI